ncbi:hypothetical protein KRR40_44580 [Niabella defluvii]|nr:hypothetical protein KRR40_44580 [Niabella sp. I65]
MKAKLEKYMDNGGNMFILGEPSKQGTLNPLLQKLGFSYYQGSWYNHLSTKRQKK